ncbi:hypothetical protein DXG01_010777 [Tephrocybe rancida]|nr:hypothetical protein DXG01_010777 [Tephrocybe rancida]
MTSTTVAGSATITSTVVEGITFGLYTRNKSKKLDVLISNLKIAMGSAIQELREFGGLLDKKEFHELKQKWNDLNDDYLEYNDISRPTFIKKKEYKEKKRHLRGLNTEVAKLQSKIKVSSANAVFRAAQQERMMKEESDARTARTNRIQDLTDKLRLKAALLHNGLPPDPEPTETPTEV